MANGDDPTVSTQNPQPGFMDQYGPALGGAVMAYLRMISSPKLAGWNNAMYQGAQSGLRTYEGLTDYQQKQKAYQTQQRALAGLPQDQQRWYNLGASPDTMMKEAGAVEANRSAMTAVQGWLQAGHGTPEQRAAAEAWLPYLSHSTDPVALDHVFKSIGLAEDPNKALRTAEDIKRIKAETGKAEAETKKIESEPPGGSPKPASPDTTARNVIAAGQKAYDDAFNQYIKSHPYSAMPFSGSPSREELEQGARAAGQQAREDAIQRYGEFRQAAQGKGAKKAPVPTDRPPEAAQAPEQQPQPIDLGDGFTLHPAQ